MAGLGAGLMFVLDPDRGRRRRALVRDKLVRVVHKSGQVINARRRDLRYRAAGMVATARMGLTPDVADDDQVVARVRATAGRIVSHPGALLVSSSAGRVTVAGPVLADEVRELLTTVGAVRGVHAVDNRLTVHARADGVPALQGGRSRHVSRLPFMQRHWSPTERLVAATAGIGIAAWGLGHRSGPGLASIAAGAGLIARAAIVTPDSIHRGRKHEAP